MFKYNFLEMKISIKTNVTLHVWLIFFQFFPLAINLYIIGYLLYIQKAEVYRKNVQ